MGMAIAALVVVACSSEEDHNHSHTGLPASCQAIVDACHHVDDGSDQAVNDCHTKGHDGKADADCASDKDRCVALCEAKHMQMDGGMEGGHMMDGGHHD